MAVLAATTRSLFTPEEIVRTLKHLPSAPKILPRLKLLLRDGNSSLDEIVTLVRLDPGLAMRVLQIANSPYFYAGARCLTVEDAVRRVGFDEIYALVSYAVATQVLNRPLATYGMEANELWARSVACALAAEALAHRTGDDPAVAYTFGLLHGVGMIAIDEWCSHTGRDCRFAIGGFPHDAEESERAQLGLTQAETGAALLAHWDFPTEIVVPVRFQYSPRATPLYPTLTALLFAAKWVAAAVLSPDRGVRHSPPAAGQLQSLGIASTALSATAPSVARKFRIVSGVLDAVNEALIDRPLFPAQRWQP